LNIVSTVFIILTFVVAVYGHECKDFKLSASDQSVIDMMKHYLYTSRQFLDTICIYIISMSDDVSLVGQELLALSQDMSYLLIV
jgi:hypothetical protein